MKNPFRIGILREGAIAFLIAIPLFALAQSPTGEIRGKVLDASTSEPLIGANVIIQGTTKGTTTNNEGVFSLKEISPGKYQIVARYIGYISLQQSVEVAAGQTAEAEFKLVQDMLRTDEMVVTGLAGSLPRSELGSSIAKVTAKEIEKLPVTSVMDALAGKVAGVQVTKSTGTPGTGTYVVLRGRRTVTGSSQPLYVIDGVIIDNTFIYNGSGTIQGANRAADIDPNDVESMEVLKGASAAAMYGSRAANGVVLITTKSGKQAEAGKLARVNYSTSISSDDVPSHVPLQTKYGQRVPYTANTPGSTDSYGSLLPAGTSVFAHDADVFQKGRLAENALSVSGGTPLIKYLVSGTFTNQRGVAIKSDYTRQNLRLNVTYTPFTNFSIHNNSNYLNSTTNLPQDGSNTSGILLGSLRTPPEFDNSTYLEGDGVSQRRFASYDNPIWTMQFNTYKTELTRFVQSTGFDYSVSDGLLLSGSVGWDRYNQFNSQRLYNGASATTNRAGAINQDRYTNDAVNTDLSLTGKYQLTDDFLGTLIVGQQLLFNVRNTTSGASSNTLPFYNEIGAGITKDAGSSRSESRIYSYFAQGTVNAWDRLTLTAALRRDAGSTFGSQNLVYYYPKASVAYRISQESFFKDAIGAGIVDEAKLRLAWGKAGKDPGTYATNNLYLTSGFADPWGRSTSAGRNNQIGLRNSTTGGNNEVKPEINTELETGFDVTLLDRRINVEFSYYSQDISQMLLFVDVPTSTGFLSQYRNAGEMTNKGFEIKLDVNTIRSDVFSWVASVNYARNKNEVTKLEGFSNSYITLTGAFVGIYNIAKEGKPLGTWLGGGYLRDAVGNIVHSDPTNAARYDNVLGQQYIKGAPLFSSVPVELGKADPDWTGSLKNSFSFLNGDLNASILFDAAIGMKVWDGTRGALYNFGTHKDTEDRDQPWFNDAGEPVIWVGANATDTLRLYSGARKFAPGQQLTKEVWYRTYANGFNINEPHIEDGSYIKLREISLSYRLKRPGFFNFESIVFTATARNLKTWTDYTGYDPEVNTFQQAEGRGFDYFTLPQVRSFKFSLSINY